MSFIKFGKFSAIISSNIFPPSLSPLLWHSHYAQVGTFVLNISESLFYLIPFPFCYSDGSVSYTHLTLPTIHVLCRSRWSPYH